MPEPYIIIGYRATTQKAMLTPCKNGQVMLKNVVVALAWLCGIYALGRAHMMNKQMICRGANDSAGV